MRAGQLDRSDFCVYMHKRLVSGVPFYIGKGLLYRAHNCKSRSEQWKRIVAVDRGRDVEFIVQNVDEELAFLVEMEAIDKYRRIGFVLVNQTGGGQGMAGYKASEETKKKMSAKQIGNKYRLGTFQSAEARAKISAAHKGRKLSPEHVAKVAAALIGKKASAETRLKLSLSHKGKRQPLSLETKAKISAAHKGLKLSDERKAHLSDINKGKTLSEEAKQKISMAHKGRTLSTERRAQMVEVWKRRKQCVRAN
jgi:formate-dependent nitrite reductase cytochrome c552 subunit